MLTGLRLRPDTETLCGGRWFSALRASLKVSMNRKHYSSGSKLCQTLELLEDLQKYWYPVPVPQTFRFNWYGVQPGHQDF